MNRVVAQLTIRAVAALAIAALPASVGAATLALDATVQYQTIDGFGTFWQGNTAQSFATFLANDLGESVVRFMLPTSFCPSAGNYVTSAISGDIAQMNRMKALGVTCWFTSVWTPPAWMKDNNSEINGGALLASHYTDFANMAVHYCQAVKQQTGVDLYAFSCQNELAFSEWYVSCVYSTTQYRDLIKVVGPAFRAAGLPTKLLGAEDMLDAIPSRGYFGAINADTAARPYLGIAAVHGYTDGINPVPASSSASSWRAFATIGSRMGIHTWMSETSGVPDTWAGAMDLASNIYMALRYANLSAWVWWHDCGAGGSTGDLESLVNASTCGHSQRSLVSKNYYKWVRPGAVRMSCAFGGDSTSLFATAFSHTANRTLTIVMINQGTAAKTVSISGASCPATLELFRTSTSENCVDVGSVTSSNVTLAAGSVNTLYATNYTVPLAVMPQGQVGSRVTVEQAAIARGTEVFGLDGRALGAAGNAHGVRVSVRYDAAGRVAGSGLSLGR
jgi:glucuronoarabinoxylan endo-1,4-beta-xylanase